MGESDRYQEYKHYSKKTFALGSENNALVALVVLNIIFFLLLLLLQVVYFFYNQSVETYQNAVIPWFELPSNLYRYCERPWTLFSFMFSDTGSGIWRMLSNMFWLWTFGSIAQAIMGNEKIFPVYLYGGLFSGLTFLILGFQNNASLHLIGANTSILALATAVATCFPNYRVFEHIRKGVPLWLIVVIYMMIDAAGLTNTDKAYWYAHLAGALTGVGFSLLLKIGVDGSKWMNLLYFNCIHLFSPKHTTKGSSVKDKIFYATGDRAPFTKISATTQDKIDRILDKINEKGFNSLTEEEKKTLSDASENENL